MTDIYKLIAAYKKPNAAKNLKQFARFVHEYNDDSEKTIDKFVKKFSRIFKRFEKVLKRKEKVLLLRLHTSSFLKTTTASSPYE